MVMEEMAKPRDTFVLMRGDFRTNGEQVAPGVPASLPPLPAGAPANRLGLARWLVDPANPLVGRVTVNRFWQQYFGTGLVKTERRFRLARRVAQSSRVARLAGRRSSSPSGWDIKALQRLIVMSATYRQSSHVDAELLASTIRTIACWPAGRGFGSTPRWSATTPWP